ncbi:hypothetical protein [Rhizobium sp. Leaf383]|uniref:hypothetical protein n=1 Tax=Rhizobium sp. Leaf383 TaxID=1736357 RepID=UPI000714E04F|nr:hypothetical protein [Rhizobium sp. Leaf383]KQS84268.1 hypothetical protein ASG58_21090 [Rhizobium sp. Leaf383]
MALGSAIFSIISPKSKAKTGGVSATGTYNPQQTQNVLTAPQYQEHLSDIFSSRQADDARTLMVQLFEHDPDVSAAVHAWLTMANTMPIILVRDMDGQIDAEATKALMQRIKFMTMPTDYTKGFQMKQNLDQWCEEIRYMVLLRGGAGVELVFDEKLLPADLRNVDLNSVEWFEKKPGEYKPRQKVSGLTDGINLDIPTFFVSFYRQNPTKIYSNSPFVSTINTIAARQQVINDLYRIMQYTGYPRLEVTVVEEVLRKNMPVSIKLDESKQTEWINARLGEIRNSVQDIRADTAFVHMDSVEPGIMNEKSPGAGIDISKVIETLNAQNQAGLKTMATVIGRGTAGVNTSSVEARLASMNADELNGPVAAILTNIFSFMLHQDGYQGFAEVAFVKGELRPDLELEPQLTMRQSRLLTDLSHGLITDLEYHLQMYNRLPPDGAPELSGTGFMTPAPAGGRADEVSPNSDPLGRSLAPEGSKMAKSKQVQKPAA